VKPVDDGNGYETSDSEGPPGEGINRISWNQFLRFVDEPAAPAQQERTSSKESRKRKISWEKGYRQLKKLKRKYGTAQVPSGGDPELEAWVDELRHKFIQKSQGQPTSLSDERYAALQNLGFTAKGEIDNKKENTTTTFEKRLEQLRAFQREFHHLKVPRGYTSSRGLRAWLVKTREQMKAKRKGKPSELTDDQMEALNELGLFKKKGKRGRGLNKENINSTAHPDANSPATSKPDFQQRLAELKAFQAAFGTTYVPRDYANAPGLREWTKETRKQFWEKVGGCPTQLTDGQIYELNEIDFEWDEEEESTTNDAEELAEQSSSTKVPARADEPLGMNHESNLLHSKTSTANTNGNKKSFVDHVLHQNAWQKNHSPSEIESSRFSDNARAHLKPPPQYSNNNQLESGDSEEHEPEIAAKASSNVDSGFAKQDEKYGLAHRDVNCDFGRPKLLKRKSSTCKLHINSWLARMKQLRDYKAKHGHIEVPEKYPEDQHFSDWVQQQKRDFVRRWSGDETALTNDRFQALQQVGFIGQAVKAAPLTFDERVSQLKEFYSIYGHAQVPKKYVVSKGLRKWLSRMRAEFKALEQGGEAQLSFGEIEVLNSLEGRFNAERGDSSVAGAPSQKIAKRYESHNGHGVGVHTQKNGLQTDASTKTESNRSNDFSGEERTSTAGTNGSAESSSKLKDSPKIKVEEEDTAMKETPKMRTEYDTTWEGRLQQLEDYKVVYGDIEVPLVYEQDQGFATWVRTQRRLFAKRVGGLTDALSDERYNLLKNIGFGSSSNKPVAQGPITFETRLKQLEEYKALNGNTSVPQVYEPDQAFANWVRTQRRLFSSRLRGITDALSDDRFYALQKLDFAK
jgi:Helicase associated domain